MKKYYCFECDKDVESVILSKEEIKIFRDVEVKTISKIRKCKYCNNEIYDETLLNIDLKEAYEKYLSHYNLNLNSFKTIRKNLNLTQEEFASLLSWSKKSIIRYENNQLIPQKAFLKTYIKLQNDFNYIFELIDNSDIEIESKKFLLNKINNNSKLYNLILLLLEKKEMCTTELMKYLFAIDFLAMKTLNRSITQNDYLAFTHGPVLKNYNYILNNLENDSKIISREVEFSSYSAIIYSGVEEPNIKLFDDDELKIIEQIISKFKGKTATELSKWSHEFIGWINNEKKHSVIDYKYAKDFKLW